MADTFESSRRKIARAEHHFTELQKQVGEFLRSRPYERIVEAHPTVPGQLVHKIRLTSKMPPSIADIAGEILQNLRNALDNAGYAIAVAAGKRDPKYSAFPFAGSLAQVPNSLGRSKDIPQPIQSVFLSFQPYLGGDDLLWALNEMCIADKHKMVIPIVVGVNRNLASVRGTGFFSMPNPHVWDRNTNEMELLTLGPGTQVDFDFQFEVYIAINGIKVVDGQPIVPVLSEMKVKVNGIIDVVAAESRRLGLIL